MPEPLFSPAKRAFGGTEEKAIPITIRTLFVMCNRLIQRTGRPRPYENRIQRTGRPRPYENRIQRTGRPRPYEK